jgi:Domain of unknown function (DUF4258)
MTGYAIVKASLKPESSVERYQIVFSVHAALRMSKWSIDEEDIQTVVDTGEVIEEYPNALPLPCQLMMGRTKGRHIHVVVARIEKIKRAIIITSYVPDPTKWEPDPTDQEEKVDAMRVLRAR